MFTYELNDGGDLVTISRWLSPVSHSPSNDTHNFIHVKSRPVDLDGVGFTNKTLELDSEGRITHYCWKLEVGHRYDSPLGDRLATLYQSLRETAQQKASRKVVETQRLSKTAVDAWLGS